MKYILYLVLANGSHLEGAKPHDTLDECKNRGRQMVAAHVVVKNYLCHPYTVTEEEGDAYVSKGTE